MITDDELQKMYKIYLNSKGIAVIIFYQVIDMSSSKYDKDTTRLSELLADDFNKFVKELPKSKYNLFVDMSKIVHPPFVNIKQAKNFNKIASHNKINKIAAIYGNQLFKAVSTFIIGMAGKNEKFQMFETKKEALQWLS